MDLNRRLLSLFAAFLITATGGVVFSASSDLIELRIRVDDVYAYRGQQDVSVPVWLDNYMDTVAGFSIWLMMDRQDLALFRTDTVTVHDTTYWQCLQWNGPECIDSVQVWPDSAWDFIYVWIHEAVRTSVDTVGTLISGWEYVNGNSLSGIGSDQLVVGLADMPGGDVTPGIPPQESSRPLIKLVADAFDSLGTVHLLIQEEFIDHFNFATPDGSSIGLMAQEFVDTSYWLCMQWSGDTCLNWQQVSGPPYDSISVQIDTIMVLDTTAVEIINGSITIVDGYCGDMNGSSSVDVADLTFMVNYLFVGGPPPPNIWTADCDGSGSIDVNDLTCWVCYLFLGCPPPACEVWF